MKIHGISKTITYLVEFFNEILYLTWESTYLKVSYIKITFQRSFIFCKNLISPRLLRVVTSCNSSISFALFVLVSIAVTPSKPLFWRMRWTYSFMQRLTHTSMSLAIFLMCYHCTDHEVMPRKAILCKKTAHSHAPVCIAKLLCLSSIFLLL